MGSLCVIFTKLHDFHSLYFLEFHDQNYKDVELQCRVILAYQRYLNYITKIKIERDKILVCRMSKCTNNGSLSPNTQSKEITPGVLQQLDMDIGASRISLSRQQRTSVSQPMLQVPNITIDSSGPRGRAVQSVVS